MHKLKPYLVLLAGAALGLALSLKFNAVAKPAANDLPLEELRTFSRVFKHIKENYVEEISDKELLNNAISGMVSSLDPHSAYMLPDNFKELSISTSGKFGGLGIEVSMEDGFVKVVSPIDDTPAQRAGIQAGDLIIRIDDKPVKGMTLNEAVKLMRGKIGTAIEITIIREGIDQPKQIKIIRDEIKVRSVKSELLEPHLGYLRISQFQAQTPQSLHQEVGKLVKANDNTALKGLVLDLRNNPGGVLNAAVGVSDAFLKKGKIVYTEGRASDSKSEFTATGHTAIPDVPVVVIINGGSASASEIVAGALQDHKRAIIVGSKSFGKGSVQTVMPLTKGAGLKITTARYFTPNGRSIQAEGITPDIEVTPVEIKNNKDDTPDLRISEKDLAGHLENKAEGEKTDKKDDTEKDSAEDAEKNNKDLIYRDFVLFEALTLLKGMSLLR